MVGGVSERNGGLHEHVMRSNRTLKSNSNKFISNWEKKLQECYRYCLFFLTFFKSVSLCKCTNRSLHWKSFSCASLLLRLDWHDALTGSSPGHVQQCQVQICTSLGLTALPQIVLQWSLHDRGC